MLSLVSVLAIGLSGATAVEAAEPPQGFIVELGDGSYVESVAGKTDNVRFSLGSEFTVRGKGFTNTVNAWILGNRAGGSMLEVVSQSDEEIVVRVTEIPAADEPWPANAGEDSADGFVTLKIVSDNGGRTFHARVRGAWYDCRRGEPNCS